MRLIDADALYKKLLEEIHNRSMQGFGKGLMIANSCVINAPTIEPDRKKGRWISNDIDPEAWNFCSACGEQAIDLYDFCPNCGAEMTGDNN